MTAEDTSYGAGTSRRLVLRGALALPAMVAIGRFAGARAARGARDGDEVREFFGTWVERAKLLVADDEPNEDAFLYALCADLAERDPQAFPGRGFTVFDQDGMKTGPVGNDDTFQIVELELDPGTRVPAHNHVAYDFATLCVSGEARVRHFEPEQGSAAPTEVGAELVVREVANQLLVPGRTSTLTRTRANVHALTCGDEPVRLLDFGVKFKDPGKGPRAFSVLELGEEPLDPERRTFPAKWLGNIYARKPAKK